MLLPHKSVTYLNIPKGEERGQLVTLRLSACLLGGKVRPYWISGLPEAAHQEASSNKDWSRTRKAGWLEVTGKSHKCFVLSGWRLACDTWVSLPLVAWFTEIKVQRRDVKECHSHVLSYPGLFVSTAGVGTEAREFL